MSAEACLYATINHIVALGLSPLITNDYSVLPDSPKQSIILSTRNRITRMKRLLFQEWDFQ